MKKIKIITTLCLIVALAFTAITPVFAFTLNNNKTTYYTNEVGAKMTEAQYNNLARVFDEPSIATFTQEMVYELGNDTTLERGTQYAKYVRTDLFMDLFGNVISSIETEVSEQEVMDYLTNPPMTLFNSYPIHQTAMKRLEITVNFGLSIKTVTLVNDWLSMPVTRSHDVLAIRMSGTSLTLSGTNPISGYLRYNGVNVQTYNQNHANVRKINAGVGISMPLPTGGTSMSHGMTVIVINNNNPFTAWGSFQHAQSTVTLAQSRAYNLNNNGLGNVIDFTNTTTRARYDAMRGVNCTMSTNNFWTCN